jgi:hypothetical protein
MTSQVGLWREGELPRQRSDAAGFGALLATSERSMPRRQAQLDSGTWVRLGAACLVVGVADLGAWMRLGAAGPGGRRC